MQVRLPNTLITIVVAVASLTSRPVTSLPFQEANGSKGASTIRRLTSHPVLSEPIRLASSNNGTGGSGSQNSGSFAPNFTATKLRLHRVVCNYDASAEHRTGVANFTIAKLDVQFCTDLYYDYARLDSIPVASELPVNLLNWPFYSYEPIPGYATLNDHKVFKPNLVSFVTVSEGGDNASLTTTKDWARPGVLPGLTFKLLVEREQLLSTFSTWAIYLLRLWGFDGLALRWPAETGPELLHKLLRTLRSRFQEEVKSGGAARRDRLKLAVLLDTNKGGWLRGYDMHAISRLVDQITLEAVRDKGETNMTRILQPLFYKGSSAPGPLQPLPTSEPLTIDEAVKLVVNAGVSRDRVNVAISLIGQEFLLKDPNQNGTGADVDNRNGSRQIFYYEICNLLSHTSLFRASSTDKSPYLVHGERWISFEDEESIAQKVDYLKTARIGGVAIFSQSDDDFSGEFCGQGKFPLSLKAFLDADVQDSEGLLSLPWQPYCSGQLQACPLSTLVLYCAVSLGLVLVWCPMVDWSF